MIIYENASQGVIMPIYEYQCADCSTIFEKIRSIISADHPIECESCHSLNNKRILSTFFTYKSGVMNSKSNSSCVSCSGGNCSTCH